MAERVFEKYARQADEISAKLRAMKPTGKELDRQHIGTDLYMAGYAIEAIAEARAEAQRGNDQT